MAPHLTRAEAIAVRMHGHALWSTRNDAPGGIVQHFVAMQAQEYSYALWATAQRMTSAPDAAVLAASADAGELLRTHVLRPTWHFVTPSDARWLLQLTGPRVQRINAPYLRREGLDEDTLARAFEVIEAELAGASHRTRKQLHEALSRSGSNFTGFSMGLVMMEAELRCLVISGASIGRQRSYALFDERVPAARQPFDRDWALGELVGRFIATRGPATLKDFAVWSGLTLADATKGLAIAQELQPGAFEAVSVEEFDCWWQPPHPVPTSPLSPRVDLVQGYDEYVMSYFPTKQLMQPTAYGPSAGPSTLLHTVLIDGVMAGQWKHTLNAHSAKVQLATLRELSAAERAAVETAVADYGEYLGLPVSADWP